ncbi:hypothetical protein M3J09_011952 [Ascochyta lentis]
MLVPRLEHEALITSPGIAAAEGCDPGCRVCLVCCCCCSGTTFSKWLAAILQSSLKPFVGCGPFKMKIR